LRGEPVCRVSSAPGHCQRLFPVGQQHEWRPTSILAATAAIADRCTAHEGETIATQIARRRGNSNPVSQVASRPIQFTNRRDKEGDVFPNMPVLARHLSSCRIDPKVFHRLHYQAYIRNINQYNKLFPRLTTCSPSSVTRAHRHRNRRQVPRLRARPWLQRGAARARGLLSLWLPGERRAPSGVRVAGMKADDPDRLVAPEEMKKPTDDDPKAVTAPTAPSNPSIVAEVTATPSPETAQEARHSVAPSGTGESLRRVRATWQKELAVHPDADYDEVAQAFRDDLAHRSDLMSPGVPR
jgi:hypothetical protein